MKILLIHPKFSARGGAERKILFLYQRLITKGHDVDIICFDKDLKKSFHEYIDDNALRCFPIFSIFFLPRLIKFYLESQYYLVIASNYPAHIITAILNIVRKVPKKIWICNEVHSSLHKQITLKHKLIIKIEKIIVKSFDIVVANSKNTQKNIQDFFNIESKLIYPGVKRPSEANQNNDTKINPYFFCISRLSADKNIHFIEEILKHTKQRIVFAGDGDLSQYLTTLEKDYDHFTYVGNISEDEKVNFYFNAKAMLFLPSNEPFGVTLIESIYFSTPVIAFNNGGPKEIIVNGKNGILCDDNNEYINSIINFDDHKFDVSFFKPYVEEKFLIDRMLDNFENTIETLIK